MNPRLARLLRRVVVPEGVTIGRHSYGYEADTFRVFTRGTRIELGAFCSIGPEVQILVGAEHHTTRATTFPLNARLFDPAAGNLLDVQDSGATVIGDDVWIGLGAAILSGVAVGDGAVIGARAVVSKHVPPYAVVVGNPAEIVRFRFAEETRRRLLALQWWEWSDREIVAFKEWFMGDVDAFLDEAERVHGPRPEGELTLRLRAMEPALLTPQRARGQGAEGPG